ncbi:hypothetical protein AB0A74_30500 [Saccharothrix sp. NPDC042600]|nr:hypothetical protein GCM10017745_39020 [Saccharothrix mutabilis subsp. capreolus]
MVRLGVVALLLATVASACAAEEPEYVSLIEACDLVDPGTVTALSRGLPAAPPSREPVRFSDDRVDMVECRHEFGDSGNVPVLPHDDWAPDTPGTPLYRYVTVTVMRYRAGDGRSATGNARHHLASDPQAKDPAITGAGLDDGDVMHKYNGVQSYSRVRAVDHNVFLTVEYGGANGNARPQGMPADESREGALRLLTGAASRLPCPKPGC